MGKFLVLCALATCITIADAVRLKPKYPSRRSFCYDHNGNKVAPRDRFFDGCNWCRCGPTGVSTMCTKKLCFNMPKQPFLPTKPIKPSKKKPIRPVFPGKTIKLKDKPVFPSKPRKLGGKPIYPGKPIKPNGKPTYPGKPIKFESRSVFSGKPGKQANKPTFPGKRVKPRFKPVLPGPSYPVPVRKTKKKKLRPLVPKLTKYSG